MGNIGDHELEGPPPIKKARYEGVQVEQQQQFSTTITDPQRKQVLKVNPVQRTVMGDDELRKYVNKRKRTAPVSSEADEAEGPRPIKKGRYKISNEVDKLTVDHDVRKGHTSFEHISKVVVQKTTCNNTQEDEQNNEASKLLQHLEIPPKRVVNNITLLLHTRELGGEFVIKEKVRPVLMFRDGLPVISRDVRPDLLQLPTGPTPPPPEVASRTLYPEPAVNNDNNVMEHPFLNVDEDDADDVLYESESDDDNEPVGRDDNALAEKITKVISGAGNWVKLGVKDRKHFQVGVVGELVYSSFSYPYEPVVYVQNFYSYCPGTYEFKLLLNQKSAGRIIKIAPLKYMDEENHHMLNQLIVLNEGNELLAYDINSRPPKLIERKNLSILIGGDSLINDVLLGSFTNFEILYKERKILVMKRDATIPKNIQAILILPFPSLSSTISSWNDGSVIKVEVPEMKLKIIKNDDTVMVTTGFYNCAICTWSSILNTTVVNENGALVSLLSSARKKSVSSTSVRILHYRRLQRLPQNSIKMHMPTHNFHHIANKIGMGLLHGRVGSEIQFFPIDCCQQNDKSSKLVLHEKGMNLSDVNYEYKALDFTEEQMLSGNCKTSRLLLCSPTVGKHEVVTFTQEQNGCISSEVNDALFSAMIGNKPGNEGTSLKTVGFNVISVAQCSSYNLIAVLFWEKEKFQVKLFDSKSLILRKELEIIDRKALLGRDVLPIDLKKATIEFHEVFLLVNLYFKNGIYDEEREVYCRRFYSEQNKNSCISMYKRT